MTESDRKVRLVAPDEPPQLTPGAAKVLLRILLKAAENPSRTKTRRQTEK
ncbi:hypothetical protein [Actinomadura geliboluensis]|nr:hypothetical protein [Actinomadura geliboluensis]